MVVFISFYGLLHIFPGLLKFGYLKRKLKETAENCTRQETDSGATFNSTCQQPEKRRRRSSENIVPDHEAEKSCHSPEKRLTTVGGQRTKGNGHSPGSDLLDSGQSSRCGTSGSNRGRHASGGENRGLEHQNRQRRSEHGDPVQPESSCKDLRGGSTKQKNSPTDRDNTGTRNRRHSDGKGDEHIGRRRSGESSLAVSHGDRLQPGWREEEEGG
jgi:hypothetical protein